MNNYSIEPIKRWLLSQCIKVQPRTSHKRANVQNQNPFQHAPAKIQSVGWTTTTLVDMSSRCNTDDETAESRKRGCTRTCIFRPDPWW
eukprot:1054207-Amphidinium_carterae.1